MIPMKRVVPALMVSLVFNVYLLIVVLLPGDFGAGLARFTSLKGDRRLALPGTTRDLAPRDSRMDWRALRGEGLGAMPNKMRDAGFPEGVVRAIIRAEVGSLYAARRRAIAEDAIPVPYWSKDFGRVGADAVRGYESLRKEEDKTVADLLGGDPTVDDEGDDPLHQRLISGLSSAQFSSLSAINADYNDLQGQILYANGMLLPEDEEKLDYLEKQRQSDLAALLSPSELFEYQLRNSLLSTTKPISLLNSSHGTAPYREDR